MFESLSKSIISFIVKFSLKRFVLWLKTKFFYRLKYTDGRAKIILHIMKVLMVGQSNRTTDEHIAKVTGVDIKFVKNILQELHNNNGILYSQTLTNGPRQVDGLTGIFLLYFDFNPIDTFDIECARIQIEHYLNSMPQKTDAVINISNNIGYGLFYVYAALGLLESLKLGRYQKVLSANNQTFSFKLY